MRKNRTEKVHKSAKMEGFTIDKPMDYDQLASFLEVSKLQSFSRAAEKLYRTQPAISAQVRLIEQECGEKLFDRSGKKVLLTPAGEILLRYAREAC